MMRWLPVFATAVAIVVAVLIAGTLARHRAAAALSQSAETGLPLAIAALRGELEKQRAVPLILAEDAGVRSLLERPDAARLALADEKLRALASEVRAAVIYLINRQGITLAASNYSEPTSFVGIDYRFRRYFTAAMSDGVAEQYALGTVSKEPGVYFSHRVDAEDETRLGVVVVKVVLDAVEEDWRRAGQPVYVTDARGIVLATSEPQWRFRTVTPLDPQAVAEIRDSLQFGAAPLDVLQFGVVGAAGGVPLLSAGAGAPLYVEAVAPVEGGLDGWRLHLLVPADRALAAAAATARTVTGLALLLAGIAVLAVIRRVRQGRRRLAERTRAAVELEARVEARTSELSQSNRRLVAEIAERERAEARILSLREDLIQANRLASLGQITAGVAHEINQPLAAIRTYAENAGRFLARDDARAAQHNLDTVVGLTERIGAITDTLRSFARRATGEASALPLAEPIDGAMLILQSRIRDSGIVFERGDVDPALIVIGNRIRLEQVLVNLVRNALEALEGRCDPRISLRVEAGPTDVLVHVEDNGPGISPDILPVLFSPFSTSKPKGLGLGLVISSDIVAEFGGTLTVLSAPKRGAHFTVRLKRVAA